MPAVENIRAAFAAALTPRANGRITVMADEVTRAVDAARADDGKITSDERREIASQWRAISKMPNVVIAPEAKDEFERLSREHRLMSRYPAGGRNPYAGLGGGLHLQDKYKVPRATRLDRITGTTPRPLEAGTYRPSPALTVVIDPGGKTGRVIVSAGRQQGTYELQPYHLDRTKLLAVAPTRVSTSGGAPFVLAKREEFLVDPKTSAFTHFSDRLGGSDYMKKAFYRLQPGT